MMAAQWFLTEGDWNLSSYKIADMTMFLFTILTTMISQKLVSTSDDDEEAQVPLETRNQGSKVLRATVAHDDHLAMRIRESQDVGKESKEHTLNESSAVSDSTQRKAGSKLEDTLKTMTDSALPTIRQEMWSFFTGTIKKADDGEIGQEGAAFADSIHACVCAFFLYDHYLMLVLSEKL